MELLKVNPADFMPSRTKFERFIKEWKASRIEMKKETEEFVKSAEFKELQKRLSEKNAKRGLIKRL